MNKDVYIASDLDNSIKICSSYFFIMFLITQHDNCRGFEFPYHPPEIIYSIIHGTLCGYEGIACLVALHCSNYQ